MRLSLFYSLLTVMALGCAANEISANADTSPLVYNQAGDEVGVILYTTLVDGQAAAIVQPTVSTLDLGYYKVAILETDLKPRPRGGWLTSLTNQDFYNLPPYESGGQKRRFWRSSGV